MVSFDGMSFSVPHETTGRGYYRGNRWFHSDQRLSDASFSCVQSWVTASDVNPGDATLTILEGSHALFDQFGREFGQKSRNDDWYKLRDAQIQWFKDRGCVVREITCSAESMVFWDSHTMHAGKEPEKGRESPNVRCVVYLCYTARNRVATSAMLKKRITAFENGRMTTHWPHRPKLFPKNPRTYGGELPNVASLPMPTINSLGRRLVGYNK